MIAVLFEQELSRRGIPYRRDLESNRYVVEHHGVEVFVSLDNVERDYNQDFDASRIARFVDSVLSPLFGKPSWKEAQGSVLFCLEPMDHVERSELRMAISDRIDRVPVLFDALKGKIVWVTQTMLREWQITQGEMEAAASNNLAAVLVAARVEHRDIDGVRLGYLVSALPFKSAMILAPNLKEVVLPVLGWPLHAVTPTRDFLYLWAAEHTDFAGRVGRVVVDEFTKSPYPISTEVLEISDNGINAIGAFPTDG